MKNHLAICRDMGEVSTAISMDALDVLLAIEVQPGASRDCISGFNTWRGRLQVAVSSSPVDGKANDSVLDLLASELDISRASFSIRSGSTSRRKSIRISDITGEEIEIRLKGLLEGSW